MTHHYIKVHIEGPVASLVFNRPNVLNAFHNEAMDECVAALKELGDDQRVRAILVRAESRAFSAGFDMKASAERGENRVPEYSQGARAQGRARMAGRALLGRAEKLETQTPTLARASP